MAEKIVKTALQNEHPTFPKAEDILAIVGIESSFNPSVKSQLKHDPAVGLMQVRPGIWDIDPTKLSTIENQIKVGANILAAYYSKLKSPDGAVHSYNIGITNYNKKKGLNPGYVQKYKTDLKLYK